MRKRSRQRLRREESVADFQFELHSSRAASSIGSFWTIRMSRLSALRLRGMHDENYGSNTMTMTRLTTRSAPPLDSPK